VAYLVSGGDYKGNHINPQGNVLSSGSAALTSRANIVFARTETKRSRSAHHTCASSYEQFSSSQEPIFRSN